MPMSAIQLYMERLPKHQAAMRLMIGEAATVPHLEQDDRRKWARDMDELLNGGEKRESAVKPPAILRMMGIGVEFVRPK